MLNRSTKLLVLVSLTAVFLYAGPHVMGLSPFDETGYLANANGIGLNSLLTGYSPLYSYWYNFLSNLCTDPVARYFLSWRLLAGFVILLPPLLEWRDSATGMASSERRRIQGTWIYASMFLLLPILFVTPFVSVFAGVFLLSGMCWLLTRRQLRFSDASALACVIAFIVSFARPEFGYGVLLAGAATLVLSVVELAKRKGKVAGKLLNLGKIIIVGLLGAVIRFVQVKAAATGRDGIAFMQHFNMRSFEHGTLPAGDDIFFSDYAMHRFGLAHSQGRPPGIAAYFHANPGLFLGQLRDNLFDPRIIALMLLLGVAILWPWFSSRHRSLRASSVFLACISIPPVASMIVIYPRDHYAITLVPSIAIYTLQLLEPWRWLKPSTKWGMATAFTVLGCLAFSWHYDRAHFRRERLQLARIACAREIDRADLDGAALVLDMDGDLAVYVPSRVSLVPYLWPQDWAAFKLWAVVAQPAWISYDDQLIFKYRVAEAEFEGFMTKLGYTRHDCVEDKKLILFTHPNP